MGYRQEIALAKEHKLIGGVPPHVHDTVVSLLDGEPRGRILDAMAFRGELAQRLARTGFDVLVCDLYPDHLRRTGADTVYPLDSCKADLDGDMPFSDAQFDYVVLCEAIEHLENPWHLLRQAHRVLKPSGKLVLSMPNVLGLFSRLLYFTNGSLLYFADFEFHKPDHINPITYNELALVLQEVGFEIEQLVGTGHRLPALILLGLKVLRWLGWFLVDIPLSLYVSVTGQAKPTASYLVRNEVLAESQGLAIKARKCAVC